MTFGTCGWPSHNCLPAGCYNLLRLQAVVSSQGLALGHRARLHRVCTRAALTSVCPARPFAAEDSGGMPGEAGWGVRAVTVGRRHKPLTLLLPISRLQSSDGAHLTPRGGSPRGDDKPPADKLKGLSASAPCLRPCPRLPAGHRLAAALLLLALLPAVSRCGAAAWVAQPHGWRSLHAWSLHAWRPPACARAHGR